MSSKLGRLKEQDDLIELLLYFIVGRHDGVMSVSTSDAFSTITKLIAAHVEDPSHSRLKKYCPRIGPMFLPLKLDAALAEYNERTQLLKRKFVPPTFREIRHILNIATVRACAPHLKMVCLDADDTIYEDGGTISMDSPMVNVVIRLLKAGLVVALVTAAGYPNAPHKYEQRLRGLLDAFQLALELGASRDMFTRFLVMGGECNYLHNIGVDGGRVGLRVVDPKLWKDGRGTRWSDESITLLLDTAEACLRENAERLRLDVTIIRKERAVGMIKTGSGRFRYEVLEEVALSVQEKLAPLGTPHCAFNGGKDVWVDVGNKSLGIRALQAFIGPKPHQTVHVGDRFTRTGNDVRARDTCLSLWVSNPRETQFVLRLLLQDLNRRAASTSPATTPARALPTTTAPSPALSPPRVASSAMPPPLPPTFSMPPSPSGVAPQLVPYRSASRGIAVVSAAAGAGAGRADLGRVSSMPDLSTAAMRKESNLQQISEWTASGGHVVESIRAPTLRSSQSVASVEDWEDERAFEAAYNEMDEDK